MTTMLMTTFLRQLTYILLLIFTLTPPSPLKGEGKKRNVIGPNVAGQFYPANPQELLTMVDDFLNKAPKKNYEGRLLAAMAPHAGYVYSGSIAAQIFQLLRYKNHGYSTVILMGSAHYHPIQGAATVSSGVFRTPLGDLAINKHLAKKLLELSPFIEDNPKVFVPEHSIEVELPFLQRIFKDVSIVPLIMNTEDPKIWQAVGRAVAEIAKSTDTLLLVSTDLSHYPDKETARRVDRSTLKALTAALEDPLYFALTNELLLRRGGPKPSTTYCGQSALMAALFALRELKANQVTLLSYTNSGLLPNGDPERTVGYAAVIWTKGKTPSPIKFSLSPKQRKILLQMARRSIEEYLNNRKNPKPTLWADPDFNLPANVFVTLKKKGAPLGLDLRGCIGSTQLHLPLGEAVQTYAIASAVEDHRFTPVTLPELASLAVEISLLSPYQQALSHEEIKPSKHGVWLIQGNSSGLFLPQVWEQIPNKEAFLSELCSQKAGLPRDCWKDPKTQILTFTVEEFSEN